ncbi:EAL domain-containing protein [Hyphomicrobium sp. DMF-1]|uniref:EAL domain-containing protein n=1 Tax=Hyphomicrobium sp. DMF-1 TaxID=3019544 RepID=UPI0022EC11AF|nr:EAL domain-containing protein [Hyphomicrobium sp. DMF-1]WBT36967.1 EAL domain-containing protein [Hyphomicrobium sp. DMF-1]
MWEAGTGNPGHCSFRSLASGEHTLGQILSVLHAGDDDARDIVKLDMEIIRGIDSDSRKQVIVRLTLQMLADLGIIPICEGVETRRELETLRDTGVDLIQGYVLARRWRSGPARCKCWKAPPRSRATKIDNRDAFRSPVTSVPRAARSSLMSYRPTFDVIGSNTICAVHTPSGDTTSAS